MYVETRISNEPELQLNKHFNILDSATANV